MPPLHRFSRFDIRQQIRQGLEPCAEIQRRLTALRAHHGLILVAPFLPSPLIEKFTAEGFASKVERGNGGDWIVYLWRGTV